MLYITTVFKYCTGLLVKPTTTIVYLITPTHCDNNLINRVQIGLQISDILDPGRENISVESPASGRRRPRYVGLRWGLYLNRSSFWYH
jgi:hypothetical protein